MLSKSLCALRSRLCDPPKKKVFVPESYASEAARCKGSQFTGCSIARGGNLASSSRAAPKESSTGCSRAARGMTNTTERTTNALRDRKTRREHEDAMLIVRGRDRDLSTAPAWIGLPDLSGVDLAQTQPFPVDKKVRPRKRRWGEDWRELIIGASPYSRVSRRHSISTLFVHQQAAISWYDIRF